jgi:hypothetical protein
MHGSPEVETAAGSRRSRQKRSGLVAPQPAKRGVFGNGHRCTGSGEPRPEIFVRALVASQTAFPGLGGQATCQHFRLQARFML